MRGKLAAARINSRRAFSCEALCQIPVFCPSVRVRSGLTQARKVTKTLVNDIPTLALKTLLRPSTSLGRRLYALLDVD